MLTVDKDNTIHLTRGDTARLLLGTVVNEVTGKDYPLSAEDTVTFTVKKTVYDNEPAVQITVPGGAAIHITPEKTQELSFGKYLYDVQLTTADGDVYTVIPPTTFEILKEVT
mgnify:CR=1 FL=1